ncbi:hypothetical protein BX666DRAFT_1970194 [Dichotomocladium elegans]|nr:hypothetical protein BX666DRAFT_1970194 [Dichotomocladium elegans]
MWNSWFSNYAYIISCGRPFRWGADNIQADEYTKRQYRIVDPSEYILAAPSDFDERDTDDGSDEEASDEEEFNPYFRATLAERLAVITSGQVTDVNYIVCDLVQGFGGCMEELRKFIEINGVEHMKKIRGRLYIRGPVEHAMWLINLCVDLGYKGVRCTQALGPISRIERGIIYYNYPSNDDPDVACFIYFNKGFKKLTGRYKRDIHSCCCSG